MKSNHKTQNIVYTALCASLLCICAQITIPSAVPFTMQTFAVTLTGILLKKKYGIFAVIIYILLGIFGLPVFSGFRSGIGVIAGTGGGYMFGWLFLAYFSAIAGEHCRNNVAAFFVCLIGLLLCYVFGTLWYALLYASGKSIAAVLSVCVFPFILPDMLKILLAIICANKMKNIN